MRRSLVLVWLAIAMVIVVGCGRPSPSMDDAGTVDMGDALDMPDVLDSSSGGGGDGFVGPRGGAIGAACDDDEDCVSGRCLNGPQWPGGACGTDGCSECPGACAQSDEGSTCVRTCSSVVGCRSGYECVELEIGASACLASPTNLGARCETDEDCGVGECLTEWHDGYCVWRDCGSAPEVCAAAGGSCESISGGGTACLDLCDSSDDCRETYVCGLPTGAGARGVCRPPGPARGMQIPEGDVWCGPQRDGVAFIDLEIPPGVKTSQIVAFVAPGYPMRVSSLTRPDGVVHPIQKSQGWQLASHAFTVNATAVPVPPRYWERDFFPPGKYRLSLLTDDLEACAYVVAAEPGGRVLDLRFYFVGVEPTAATAYDDAVFAEAFSKMKEVLESVDIELGEIQLVDASPENTTRFEFLRTWEGVGNLFATSTSPVDHDGRLINVFVIRDFLFSGVLGIAGGIPGPAALHSTSASGTIVAYESLEDSPEDLGVTIAHELGHYLGLSHTAESDGRTYDVHDDTPECLTCAAGRGNLMHPFLGSTAAEISMEQRWVLKSNALLRATPSCPCDPLASCTPSLQCECLPGLAGDGLVCTDVDQCSSGTAGCASEGSRCTDRLGPALCECLDDYEGDGYQCLFDECAARPCDFSATCVNTSDGHECRCDPGYHLDQTACVDDDECLLDPCGPGETCMNRDGSYECFCSYGTVGTPPSCTLAPLLPRRTVDVEPGVSCALRSDGSLKCWGRSGPLLVDHPGPFREIALADSWGCGILSSSFEIACWGDLRPASLKWDEPAPAGAFRTLDCEDDLCCAIDMAGDLKCWGDDTSRQLAPQTGPFDTVDVVSRHACAIRSTGEIECFDAASYNGTHEPDGVFLDLEQNGWSSCGLRTDQKIECAGSLAAANLSGVYTDLAFGPSEVCGIGSQGTVDCWARSGFARVGPPPQGAFTQVAITNSHGCGVLTTGGISCWGSDSNGQGSVPADF